MLTDNIALAVFAASKFFRNEDWYERNVADRDSRFYSYCSLNIYDFGRRGFATIFPRSRKEFKVFDFITGDYLYVKKTGQKKLVIFDETENKPLTLQI